MKLPPGLWRKRVLDVHGQAGREWLAGLPALLERVAREWELELQGAYRPLSYNYVVRAMWRGAPAVLKAGVPGREIRCEIEALRTFDGRGAVRLLRAEPVEGLLLLERLAPGTPLWEGLEDETATRIAGRLLRALPRPVAREGELFTLSGWAAGLGRLRRRFDGGSGPFPAPVVERAEGLLDELTASIREPRLIHGDLHHGNILRGQREPWLAMDPKGLIGDPGWDAAYFAQSSLLSDPAPLATLDRRVAILAEETGLDRPRLLRWGTALSVLSGWWSYEDHGRGWQPALRKAELFQELEA